MNCQEFDHRLNAILDERSDPTADSRLLAHARQCPSCQELIADQQTLLAGLRHLPTPPMRGDFSQRIVIEVAARPVATISADRVWLAVGAVLGSAAAVLLAVSLVWYARRPGANLAGNKPQRPMPHAIDTAGRPPRNLTTLDQPLVKKKRPADGNRATSTQPSGDALAAHAEQPPLPPDWLIEAPRLPQHLRGSIDNLSATIPETAQRLNEMEQLAPGIRPIRVSISRIWDTLLSAVPGAAGDTSQPNRERTSGFRFEQTWLA